MSKARTKSESYFGGCATDEIRLPQRSDNSQVVDITISFEEAMKLHLAISECLLKLNRYHRGTKGGKETSLVLSVKIDKERIDVLEWPQKSN